MRRWVPYPFVRFVIFFICGTLTGIFYEGRIDIAIFLLFCTVIFYFSLQFFSSRGIHHFFALPLGTCAFLILFLLGYINLNIFYEKNDEVHVSNLEVSDHTPTPIYRAKIIAPLKEKENTYGTLVDIEAMMIDSTWEEARGKILLYIKKDSLLSTEFFSYGDLIIFKSALQSVNEPLNPFGFNYKAFLEHQNIFHNAFVSSSEVHLYRKGNHIGLYGAALQIQNKCAAIIRANIENEQAESIILSLVIGLRDDLDPALRNAYATAGVIHILAVSGLHVGILYSILLFTLSWLNRGKYKWMFALICLFILWTYAFVTGLSPSVLRAVAMFSSIILAKAFAKQYNIYNAIAASAFFLLCYNPFLIMSVGFQLSYMAVLGIVFLYPIFYNLISFDHRIIDAIWKMNCVSLAAQIAVLPISIYYFHQFPLYFLLANLIIIPAAFIMVVLGISLLVFNVIPFLGPLISKILEVIVMYANKFVYLVGELPNSKLDNLYINSLQVLLLFAIVVGVLFFFSFRKFSILIGVVLFFCSFQTVTMIRHWKMAHEKAIIYYSTNNTGAMGFFHGDYNKLIVTGGKDLQKDDFEYHIKPSLVTRNIESNAFSLMKEDSFENIVFKYGNLMVWNGM